MGLAGEVKKIHRLTWWVFIVGGEDFIALA